MLEKIHRDFLWDCVRGEKKIHLVDWEKVKIPMENHGLGVGNIVE